MARRFKWSALIVLVLMGVISAGKLSFYQFLSGNSCPLMGALPACYVALTGYICLALSVLMSLMKSRNKKAIQILFYTGIIIAGGLALVATVMEIFIGNICPIAFGWLPMCYVSLLFAIVIFWLFVSLTRSKARE